MKKQHPKEKTKLHPRNKHRERYNFKELIKTFPKLSSFVKLNDFGDESINFFDPEAVKMLNTALLQHFYSITHWEIPKNYLCPPIPGRADYIHHVAQLLGESNYGNTPTGASVKCLDIGVGANCIYPIIGNHEYGWSFIGAEIDNTALENAKSIAEKNSSLKKSIEFRWQKNQKDVFYGVIKKEERIDVTICNPPFYSSKAEATINTQRKIKNLKGIKIENPIKNFGGQNTELWCDGGENRFIKNMIRESKKFSDSCFWFTSLISKQSNLKSIYKSLELEKATEVKTITMGTGNKTTRIVAWTFLNLEDQKNWRDIKWLKK